MTKKKEFKDNLHTIRKAKKISQRTLAKDIGVSVSTIQGYEYGDFKPKYETVLKLAKRLQVNPADLDENLAIDLSDPNEGALLPDENGEFKSYPAGSDSDRFYTIRNVLTEEAFEQWLEIGEAFIDVPSRRKDNGRGLNKEDK